jgi:inhibitor of KinA
MAPPPGATSLRPRFLAAGDRALVVEFGDRVDRRLSEAVLRLDALLAAARPAGLVETVPTFRSLTLYFDPLATTRADLQKSVRACLGHRRAPRHEARLWHIPVCYEAAFAPDLAEVARRTGLTPEEVAARHAATRFHVYMIGFLPGFPYMGDLPPELALPRRADPRVRVPAGSVSIATGLSAIYPYESPGGWHLIGTTPVRLFDLARPRPALLAPGDAVAFEAIDAGRFAAIRAAVEAGGHETESEPLAR